MNHVIFRSRLRFNKVKIGQEDNLKAHMLLLLCIKAKDMV